MKRIILLIVIILSVGCSNYKRVENIIEKRYRDLGFWGDSKSSKRIDDTFENHYKYDFNNRFLDDYYLLCYFLSYTEVVDTTLFPPHSDFKYILNKYNNAKVILLEINTIQVYLPQFGDKIPILYEERIKDNDIEVQKFLRGELKPKFKYLYLLVSDDEIVKIKSSIKNMSLNLSQYGVVCNDDYTYCSKDTAKSMINFYYGEYDLSKLIPYEYEVKYYDSISKSLINK